MAGYDPSQIVGGLIFLSFGAMVQKQNVFKALRETPRDLVEFSFFRHIRCPAGILLYYRPVQRRYGDSTAIYGTYLCYAVGQL